MGEGGLGEAGETTCHVVQDSQATRPRLPPVPHQRGGEEERGGTARERRPSCINRSAERAHHAGFRSDWRGRTRAAHTAAQAGWALQGRLFGYVTRSGHVTSSC